MNPVLRAPSRVDRRRTRRVTPSEAADRRWAVIRGRDSRRGPVDPDQTTAAPRVQPTRDPAGSGVNSRLRPRVPRLRLHATLRGTLTEAGQRGRAGNTLRDSSLSPPSLDTTMPQLVRNVLSMYL